MSTRLDSGTTIVGDLAARLAAVRDLREQAVPDLPGRVRDVVLLACSSRGGSSMVAESLRGSDRLLHLRGEINPFLRMVGLGFPESGQDSDRLDAACLTALSPASRAILAEELAHDIGTSAESEGLPPHGTAGADSFVRDVMARLTLQWPALPLDPGVLLDTARTVLAGRPRRGVPGGDGSQEIARYVLALIESLAGRGLPLDPAYYDLPRSLRPRDRPGGAPGPSLLEEPPFVLPVPWRVATAEEAESKPLVIKTPSNAYRFGFLRALFPRARFRVVHLTRNPAAAVNGLYDGWRHHGFHAHRTTRPLAIADYSDRHPDHRWWWKFDLPSGWEEFTAAPLMRVCAFQWRSAHAAVLDDLAATDVPRLTVRYEDLIGGRPGRIEAFERLAEWLGIPCEGELRRRVHDGVAPVVATAEPRAGRWRQRGERVEAALGRAELLLAERLGYQNQAEWI